MQENNGKHPLVYPSDALYKPVLHHFLSVISYTPDTVSTVVGTNIAAAMRG